MKVNFFIKAATIAAVLHAPYSSFAAESVSSRDSSIDYSLQLDEQQSQTHTLGINISTGQHTYLRGGYGQTFVGSESSGADTDMWWLGVKRRLSDSWSMALDYDFWGRSDLISFRTTRLTLGHDRGAWYFSVAPEYKHIEVAVNENAWRPFWQRLNRRTTRPELLALLLRREINKLLPLAESSSYGLNLSVSYFGFEKTYFSIEGVYYDYEEDMTRFSSNSPLVAIMFSPTALSYVDGLSKWRASLDWGVIIDDLQGVVRWDHSVSVIDQSSYNVLSATVFKSLSTRWDLALDIGLAGVNESESALFAGLGLSYAF